MYGYGEDALTLWALRHRLPEILEQATGAALDSAGCQVFYRPSFGRKGGSDSAEFGEFDFILAGPGLVLLGESKWQFSPEFRDGSLTLRSEQPLRHAVFAWYLREWYKLPPNIRIPERWVGQLPSFAVGTSGGRDFEKPVPKCGTTLSLTLHTVLKAIQDVSPECPEVRNVLLFIRGSDKGPRTSVPLQKVFLAEDEGQRLEAVEFHIVNLVHPTLRPGTLVDLDTPGNVEGVS